MNALEPLFARLARSTFRSRFRLGIKERQYCWDKGAEVIDKHAADFIAQRLAPAHPANDGKQTPVYCQRYPLLAGHTNESAVEQRVVADAFPDKLPSYH